MLASPAAAAMAQLVSLNEKRDSLHPSFSVAAN
jgi:hypothetical protein